MMIKKYSAILVEYVMLAITILVMLECVYIAEQRCSMSMEVGGIMSKRIYHYRIGMCNTMEISQNVKATYKILSNTNKVITENCYKRAGMSKVTINNKSKFTDTIKVQIYLRANKALHIAIVSRWNFKIEANSDD